MKQTTYEIAPRGLATSFTEADLPEQFAKTYKNLFTNSIGNAEKRPGVEEIWSKIGSHITVSNFHELITQQGQTILFASGQGQIWQLNETTMQWTQVFAFETTTAKIFSTDMQQRIYFMNGADRNVFTADGITFFEHEATLEVGIAKDSVEATNSTQLTDNEIINWTLTDVTQGDVVYYPTLSAYGYVKTVTSAKVEHTEVALSADGIGGGFGAPVSGTSYRVLDTVSLNIIPASGQSTFKTNKVAATSATPTSIKINKIPDFTQTDVRKFDYIYNETQDALTWITEISTSALTVVEVSGQANGDNIRFLKSSCPIATRATSHFQRLYMIDSRGGQKIRITGPNDPEDFGSSQAFVFDISTLQPKSETFNNIMSFQRFLAVGSTTTLYLYEGTDPVGDTANNIAPDFRPIGLFPLGIASRTGMVSIGNDVHFVTDNGIRKTTLNKTANQFIDNSVSSAIDKTLRDAIKNAAEDDIQVFHYPRRAWVGYKIGSELYIYNYITVGSEPSDDLITEAIHTDRPGAWHLFDGPVAQQQAYFVRENGDLVVGGVNGRVGVFDTGKFSDYGQPIRTVFESPWLSLDPRKKINKKQGRSIKPVFEAGSTTPVTITAIAPYDATSRDQVTVTAAPGGSIIGDAQVGTAVIGGSRVTNEKLPLRWNGEVVRLRFVTDTTTGPFELTNYSLYFNTLDVE